jgi:uncharacterized membrane protein
MLEQEKGLRFTKERIAVLALWFGVLVGVRVLIGFALQNMWFGTIGTVTITFVIFYATLRYTRLQKYRQLINQSLMLWYRKKFFYVSGMVSLFILGSILGFTEYGYANYSDRLITMDMSQEDLQRSLNLLGANDLDGSLARSLQKYSPFEIMAITLASADKSLDGYYAKVVSYMFAEDIEIMVFMLLFRTRREIFTAANVKSA